MTRATRERNHNLPAQMTPLLGRETETDDIARWLSGEAVRLVTLTGPAGVGKTRLALAVAERVQAAFTDGVWFVDLSCVRDPAFVPRAITHVLGDREERDRSLLAGLIGTLCDRRLLLVLDNFEQVLAAAPSIAQILAACPGVAVLVTSRAPLRIYGEHEAAVPPLAAPTGDGGWGMGVGDRVALRPQPPSPLTFPSVQLFVQRARAVRRDFAVTDESLAAVAEICARLDGMPLAIELAAAHSKVMGPAAILARMSDADGSAPLLIGGPTDRPDRHRTLHAAIGWSYDLLTPEEQALFRRLSVFAGGFTSQTAAAVCDGGWRAVAGGWEETAAPSGNGAEVKASNGRRGGKSTKNGHHAQAAPPSPTPIPHPPSPVENGVLDTIVALVDHSLVFVREQERGEPRFGMLATVREYARERLAACGELDDLERRHTRVFLEMVERAAPSSNGARQGPWFAWLEQEHDNLRAVLRWSAAVGEVDTGLRLVRALWWFWYRRGFLSEGREWFDGVLERSRPLGNTAERAQALTEAGSLAWYQGDYIAARSLLEQAVGIQRAIGDQRGLARSRTFFGMIAQQQGDYLAARAAHEEATAIRRTLDDQASVAWSLTSLASIAHDQGDYDAARRMEEESLAIFRDLGEKQGASLPLYGLGRLAYRQGDFATARARFSESLAVNRELGETWMAAQSLNSLGETARAEGDLERSMAWYQESLVLFRELGSRGWCAMVLHNLGHTASRIGDTRRATRFFTESLALGRSLGERRNWVLCLAGLAGVAIADGRLDRAARLFGADEVLLETTGIAIDGADRSEYERNLASLRARLDRDALDAAWAEGRVMTRDQALDYALTIDEPAALPEPAGSSSGQGAVVTGPPGRPSLLTQRQREIAILISRGLTNRQIAGQLTITEGTVGSHVEHILDKLGAQSRAQVAAWVVEQGLAAVGQR